MSFDNPSGEIEPTYKKFKYVTEDSHYTKAMKKPNKYCTDRELRMKYEMAADLGDDHNMRNVPIEKAYAHIGKSQYKPNPNYGDEYNKFLMKPDKQCTD